VIDERWPQVRPDTSRYRGVREPEPFHVAIAECGPTLTVAISGELDISTAHAVARPLGNLCGRDLAIDLAGISFIDAAGVASLVGAMRVAELGGGEFRTQGADTQVLRVFEMVGLSPARFLHPR
jgi:anti-anti-sigma factor